ncbi:hypothetical protein, partial [Streptomyces sp. NPDC057910]|uniref:hypothetical protein n=1 Tax=Streptomyces sp. NPDC057910 TaxID=3346278 RepID=UPI0036EFB17F
MESAPMPEPLRQLVHQLVSEAVLSCQEVVRYAEPDQAHTWKRMTLYRATDAADTMNMAAMLIAAYCQLTDTPDDTLQSYLQAKQQRRRADGPRESDRREIRALLDEPAPGATAPETSPWFSVPQQDADILPEDDSQSSAPRLACTDCAPSCATTSTPWTATCRPTSPLRDRPGRAGPTQWRNDPPGHQGHLPRRSGRPP